MNIIEVKTLEELRKLDLSNMEITSNTEVQISLRLTDEEIEFPINVFHRTPNVESNVTVKLALFGRSSVKMPVEIHIKKGARDCKTNFKALVLLMSPYAKANVTPGLFIEEKNIQGAGHGVVIKNIKEKDLYYIRARGINKQEAKELVIPF
jgi:Fe-S cluster assembly scaffold protein SufB